MKSLATAVLALAAAGCNYFAPSPQPSASEGTWASERDRFTREKKVYDLLADVAFATATYQAPSLRVARVTRVAEWKGMLPTERDALLSKERAEAAEYEEFLLAFFTDDRRANDLATSRGTWRVALVVDGKEQALPLHVDPVRNDPTLQVLYPYATDFYQLYRIRFPRLPGPAPLESLPFTLQIAGALGKVELEWRP